MLSLIGKPIFRIRSALISENRLRRKKSFPWRLFPCCVYCCSSSISSVTTPNTVSAQYVATGLNKRIKEQRKEGMRRGSSGKQVSKSEGEQEGERGVGGRAQEGEWFQGGLSPTGESLPLPSLSLSAPGWPYNMIILAVKCSEHPEDCRGLLPQ